MSAIQTRSKQRVAEHGEVYTNEREVNAMLDLVAEQAANPEKTFLEPACGNGNFLAEILRRKLVTVYQRNKKSQAAYEQNSLIALGSLYGIELLPDNVDECRERLLNIFTQAYLAAFPKNAKTDFLRSARYILLQNIICADALKMETDEGKPIVFAEWKPAYAGKIQRRDYVYAEAVMYQIKKNEIQQRHDLFSKNIKHDIKEKILKPLCHYPLVHVLELGNV